MMVLIILLLLVIFLQSLNLVLICVLLYLYVCILLPVCLYSFTGMYESFLICFFLFRFYKTCALGKSTPAKGFGMHNCFNNTGFQILSNVIVLVYNQCGHFYMSKLPSKYKLNTFHFSLNSNI